MMQSTRDYIVHLIEDKSKRLGTFLHDNQSKTKQLCLAGSISFIPNGSLTPVKRLEYEFYDDYWFFFKDKVSQDYVAYFSWRKCNHNATNKTVEQLVSDIINFFVN
jgi:hypothetical protein